MRIFQINECEWWLANSLEEAQADYLIQTGSMPEDFEDPHELTEDELNHYKYVDEEKPERKETFKEALARLSSEGTKVPNFFSTTEY